MKHKEISWVQIWHIVHKATLQEGPEKRDTRRLEPIRLD